EKLSVLLREQITVTASGRTDAGVHARQNFAHFDFSNELPKYFLRRINFMLPDDVSVRNIFSVSDDFNARFDALERTYEYLISYEKNALLTDLVCLYPYEILSAVKLNEAAQFIMQQTDFAAFSKKRTQVKTTLCKINDAHWKWDDEFKLLRFTISADRFLRGMVRGIVATSMRFARGKLSPEQLNLIFESRQPHKTDFSAPAQGLTLIEVKYEKLMKQISFC
ncbi:MAG: tRNA pseudouridine synthase A, partial [Chitinophagales bacterium]